MEKHTSTMAAFSVDPTTGRTLAAYPFHDEGDRERIVAAAWHGFTGWRDQDIGERCSVLSRMATVLRERVDELAALITSEMGKPVAAAHGEVLKCAALCEWYAGSAPAYLANEVPDVGGDGTARVRYLPLGPVLAVMPWNFPLWQVLRAAVPILAAGNAVLLKHADNVQGCALALADAFTMAGLPNGVFGNLNVAREDLQALIADRRIAAVTVTAGVAAGSAIAAEAGRHLKKSVLELGGTDPFIVLADADLDRAVNAAVTARFQNSGQVCIAAKRIILEAPIAATFTRRFVERVQALRIGDPNDPATDLGPLARHRLRAELHDQVERSIAQGATLLTGGVVPEGPGAFYPATVLADVTAEMPVFREETFGPVAAISIARSADDAIALANDSDYGLSGALWSADVDRAVGLARQIETGGIFVNGMAASDPRVPIGGIKMSGYGRELSHFGIREFCNAQLCWSRNDDDVAPANGAAT